MIAVFLSVVHAEEPPDGVADGVDLQPRESGEMLWAGRQAVFGTRKLPFIGKVAFRTDNYVLARVRETEAGYALEQRVCKVDFQRTAGASVEVADDGHRSMPAATYFLERKDDWYEAKGWVSGWDGSDFDEDGRAGIAFRVRAPLCGGTLHMASLARSDTWALPWGGALAGESEIFVDQLVQEVDGACLRLMTRSHSQWMRGRFVYVRVPTNTTCDTVPETSWPDPLLVAPVIPDRPTREELE